MKVPVNKLVEHPEDNPRKIRTKKFAKLVESLREFPQMMELRPVVVDENYVILGGAMRYRAALRLGWTEVEVKMAKGLTEAQKREFRVKDNAHFGEWDYEAVISKWLDLPIEDWGVEIPKDAIPDPFEKEFESITDDEAEYPLVPRYGEKHTAFVIVVHNEIDEAYVRTVLGFGKRRCFKKPNVVADTNVLSAEEFIERWKSRTKT